MNEHIYYGFNIENAGMKAFIGYSRIIKIISCQFCMSLEISLRTYVPIYGNSSQLGTYSYPTFFVSGPSHVVLQFRLLVGPLSFGTPG